jgi:4-phytase/acid phosphatase
MTSPIMTARAGSANLRSVASLGFGIATGKKPDLLVPMRNPLLRAAGCLLLAAGFTPGLLAAPAAGGDDLKLVVILTRHGVRSPIHHADENLADFAAAAWPTWEVPPSYLTPHGKAQMTLMGAYYRARYTAAGLLQGDSALDGPRVFLRADSDQRTIETAQDLANGLLPGGHAAVHARPQNQPDPLFVPCKVPVGRPDRGLAIAAVFGRTGGDPRAVIEACAPEFALLHDVLYGPGRPTPPGHLALTDLPVRVSSGGSDHVVDVHGPLEEGMRITDILILEYADGMPLKQVGWGRVTPATLTQLLRLHSLYFDLNQRTLYPAQVQASNLASHLLKTMQQAATGQPDPGAIAPPEAKLVFLIGHDTNIANLGGLLGAEWWLPETQEDPVLPGGALVFELRQRRADASWRVRTYYTSQSFEQMRSGQPLTLETPPGIAPVFIPGASEAGPGFDVPLADFAALLNRVINPEFVLPSSS